MHCLLPHLKKHLIKGIRKTRWKMSSVPLLVDELSPFVELDEDSISTSLLLSSILSAGERCPLVNSPSQLLPFIAKLVWLFNSSFVPEQIQCFVQFRILVCTITINEWFNISQAYFCKIMKIKHTNRTSEGGKNTRLLE